SSGFNATHSQLHLGSVLSLSKKAGPGGNRRRSYRKKEKINHDRALIGPRQKMLPTRRHEPVRRAPVFQRLKRARPWGLDMLSTDLGLRPASQTPISCKICDSDAALYGVVDLQRPCEFPGGARPPLSGVPVYYRRCPQCSFLFTDAFDDWN